ncbi:SPOR domain-containing protein [Pelomonas sp. SE-A7]|uniref:SPOR domain-containing protein n=1 Tax=Pelomonas sp. SE-A7 TaxID=3054953 RepID=UPI00259C77CB|nr:SPOR domain-containing protein [Pelomonas sp. SE-A7]MDM4766991.1 SPOR domain-containing protein [Pelomonas sp. SE-A7]
MSEKKGGGKPGAGGAPGGGSSSEQRGGFVLGLIVGLLIGLAVALGVALYINKTPIPFVNKVPQRTAEQDAEEAERNKNWDPNAPLAGKNGKAASGVVSAGEAPAPKPAAAHASSAAPVQAPAPAPAAAPAPAPVASKAVARTESKPEAKAADAKAASADPSIYFVQAGAYLKTDDAEAQRAKLALLGHVAKIYEFEQSGRTVYRVRIGPLDARDEAEGLQKKLEGSGVEANLVRVQR